MYTHIYVCVLLLTLPAPKPGTVPDMFDQLPMLEVLDLSVNQLTGAVPASLNNTAATLRQLSLISNSFTSVPVRRCAIGFSF